MMKKVKLMAILNVTPDSFSDGGQYFNYEKAIERGYGIVEEGADIVDVGGESTRPGAAEVGEEEELKRVIPVVKELSRGVSAPISIDTMKVRVAEEAVAAGAKMINDVSGFTDSAMRRVAADTGVDICVMHMQGQPRNMQDNPHYERGVVEEVVDWFRNQVDLLLQAGVKEEKIILDPGIGFGKTVKDNVLLLKNIAILRGLGFPILLGASRKSFMRKILGREDIMSDATTIAVNTMAMLSGVDIIRVHAVKEHRDVIDLLSGMN